MTPPPTIAETESNGAAGASADARSTPAAGDAAGTDSVNADTDSVSVAAGDDDASADTETLLALLGDEYACRLLVALEAEPLSAADLVDRCEMSRPTVYRRLDRLTDAGLVEAVCSPSASGHHHQEYRLAVETVAFSLSGDGVDGELREPPSPC
ncbi:ArsR/SmtB family transcription factor [Halohasta salina]|uniref:ArsR/SmtB family transcription factor n=1 Tax=Halohasta salina TaxID=2961621 RepID=UPI0020A31590|nr:winged helix-turn-helix domain-containing protein [Halohasta salina]